VRKAGKENKEYHSVHANLRWKQEERVNRIKRKKKKNAQISTSEITAERGGEKKSLACENKRKKCPLKEKG